MTKIDKKQILISSAKSVFGAIPYGGALLDELFFEYNGRIKQERFNSFVQILADNFTQDSKIHLENIKTEDFNDLFESVLRRVVQTKSEKKLVRFKDILINEMNCPSDNPELIEHYLDLISILTEIEISILSNHRHFTLEFEDKIDEHNSQKEKLNSIKSLKDKETIVVGESKYQKQLDTVQTKYNESKDYINSFSKYKTADFYNITENNFMFYKQRLFSKGLLIDNRMNRIGSTSFQNMGITEFGIEFIDFIKNSGE